MEIEAKCKNYGYIVIKIGFTKTNVEDVLKHKEFSVDSKCEFDSSRFRKIIAWKLKRFIRWWRWLKDMVKGYVYNRGRIAAATASALLAGEDGGPGRLGGGGHGGLGGGETGHMGRWQDLG